MPVYNSEKHLLKAMNSVLNQTFDDFELIVVNDGSTDSTEKIVKRLLAHDKRIKYICNKINRGKSHSNNIGIRNAKGEYIQIFDSDDIMINYKLEIQSKILDKYDKVGLVVSDAFFGDDKGRITTYWSIEFSGKKKKRRTEQILPDSSLKLLQKTHIFPPCGSLYRKALLEQIGDFDERLTMAEDWDMHLRLSEVTKVYYLPLPAYIYRVRQDSLFHSIEKKGKKKFYDDIVREKMRERKKLKNR